MNIPNNLTIILPVYNHAKYLTEALESILKQTVLPKHVVLIDDASLDESAVIAAKYAMKYDFIHFVQNSVRVGPNKIFNAQVLGVKTDYTFFMSADDSIHPCLFETALGLLNKHPDAGVFSALSNVIDESGRYVRRYYSPVIKLSPTYLSPAKCRKLYQTDGNWILGGTRVFRTAVIQKMKHLTELHSFSDTYLTTITAITHGACFCPTYLSNVRMDGANYSSGVMRNEVRLKEIMQQVEEKFLSRIYFNKKEVSVWKKRFMLTAIISLLSYNKTFDSKKLKDFIPEQFQWTRMIVRMFYPLLRLRLHFLNGVILYLFVRPTDLLHRCYRYFFYSLPCKMKNRKVSYQDSTLDKRKSYDA